jgi:predicted LPLAT superfamily acyltransferase
LGQLHDHLAATGTQAPGPSLWRSFLQFREFALSIVDRVAMWGGRQSEFRFDFSGREYFEKLAEERRGAIIVGAHLGSFDALRVLSVIDRVKVNVLMYTEHAPRINAIFRELSPDANLRVIHADPTAANTALEIRACIGRGEWVAILGDRVEPGDRHRTLDIDFLGQPALFPEAPFMLPVILGCPAVLMLALRRGPWDYVVFAEPLAEPLNARLDGAFRRARAREIAATYAARLEHYCSRAPLQWFNFFDFWQRKNAR